MILCSRIFVCFHVDYDNFNWRYVDNDDHWSPFSPTLRSSLCTSLLIKGTAFWSKAPLHFYATKLLKQRIKSSMRRQSNASRRFPSSSIGPPELFFKILKDPKRPQPTNQPSSSRLLKKADLRWSPNQRIQLPGFVAFCFKEQLVSKDLGWKLLQQ